MNHLPFGEPGTAPLAERLRPVEVDEVTGQDAILGPGAPLRTLIERGNYRSLLFWGPPGTGKTTVGRIIAHRSNTSFVHLSAALSGVKEVKAALERSRERFRLEGKRDLLFLDEIHRFTRTQQDVLLTYLEEGSVFFIGATTENPSFYLTAALLSRCQLFCFSPLSNDALRGLLGRALHDPEGLADAVRLSDEALDAIIELSDGDARRSLTTLELAAAIAPGQTIDLELVERAVQRKGLNYDRAGDEHYNLISALHKSIRNSDPDAALYWLARMIEGGEDPRFLARRLIRIASEDVGLADPQALPLAIAAAETVERIGLPECNLALAETAVYLSCAPKSNAVYVGYEEALNDVRKHSAEPVPLHLRNAPTRLMKGLGYGKGYQYAHDLDAGVANMECLPASLSGRTYYRPTQHGNEEIVKARLDEIKRARRNGGKKIPPPAT